MTTEGETTSTTLTAEDCVRLRGYFTVKQHEFLNSNAYITEAAITTRIEDVDPAWRFEILNISNRDAQVTALGRLTIKGVSRDGIGMAKITLTRDGKGEANEAEKSAATDALKRAARLFGIGRYLLEMEGVTDVASLTRWLNPPPHEDKPATPKLVPTPNGAKADLPNGAGADGKRKIPPTQGTPLPEIYTLVMGHPTLNTLYSQINHRRGALDKLDEYGIITPELPLAEIVNRFQEYHAARSVDKMDKRGGTDAEKQAATLAALQAKYVPNSAA